MTKVNIEIEIPNYDVKCCSDSQNDQYCRFLESYNYGFDYYCVLLRKDITKIDNDGKKVYRPYECRRVAKRFE